MRNVSDELEALAEEIATGKAYFLRLLARGMDTSGVARQIDHATMRACSIVIDNTELGLDNTYPELLDKVA